MQLIISSALILVGWWLIMRAVRQPRKQVNDLLLLEEKKKLWNMQEQALKAHKRALELEVRANHSLELRELDVQMVNDALIREDTAKFALRKVMEKHGESEEVIQQVLDAIEGK